MPGPQFNVFLKFPRSCLLLTALVALPLLYRSTAFKISSESQTLLEGDRRSLSSYQEVKRILAETEVVVVSMEIPDLFTPRGMNTLRRVSEAFLHQPGVEDVKSLTHASKPVRKGFSFAMEPLISGENPGQPELDELKKFALEHPLMRNVMVSPDARHTLITVNYRVSLKTSEEQRRLRDAIDAVLQPFRAEGLKFQTLALPLIEEEIRSTLRADIKQFVPAAVALLTVILWLTFRSWRLVLLVLLNQVAVLALLPGVIDLTGYSINVFSVMLFPLLSGIHLNLLAHVYSSWQRHRAAGKGALEAIETMIGDVFKSSAFATLTSCIGMISLTLSGIDQIREFGLLGMVGTLLIFFVTFGPGLSLLRLVTDRWLPVDRPGDDEQPHPLAERVGRLVQRRRMLIVVLGLASIGVATIGIGMTRTDIRAVEFLNRKSPTRQAVEELDRVYGGINAVQIEINSGQPNGINNQAFLRYVDQVQHFAEAHPSVSSAYSYSQLMAMMNQIWEGNRPEGFRVPDNPWVLNLFVAALKAYNFPFLTALADEKFQTAYVVVRTRDMPSAKYLSLLEDIMREAEKKKPPGIGISAAKGIHSILEADRQIMRSQLNTAGFTTIVIGLVLSLLWRSPLLALVSLLTNAVPAALVVAMTGYAGVPLNSITIMVAAICLGIAVDDSIHFITHWRDERNRGASAGEAVLETLRIKGRPITWTSVILIGIFSVFTFFSFPPIVHFGLLAAFAFASALLSVLFVLPAMLCFWRSAGVDRNRKQMENPR